MNRLEYLLQRYYKRIATQEEILELIKMSRIDKDGAFDKFIDNPLQIDSLHQKQPPLDKVRQEAMLQNLHQRIEFNRDLPSHAFTAEKKTIPIERGQIKWWSVAAVFVAGLLVFGKFLFDNRDVDKTHLAETSTEINIVEGKNFIVLPDSSTVMLNEGSRLVYSESYGTKLREVILIGEGFFDVKPDPERKFLVRSGKVTTSVLGTAFNVKAFPNDPNIIVTVARGKVSVLNDEEYFGTITRDEQIAVNIAGDYCVRTTVNAEEVINWTSKFLIINNERVKDATAKIADRYGVKITLANEAVTNCRISSAFLEKSSLEDVLVAICTLLNATYEQLPNGSILIHGGKCP